MDNITLKSSIWDWQMQGNLSFLGHVLGAETNLVAVTCKVVSNSHKPTEGDTALPLWHERKLKFKEAERLIWAHTSVRKKLGIQPASGDSNTCSPSWPYTVLRCRLAGGQACVSATGGQKRTRKSYQDFPRHPKLCLNNSFAYLLKIKLVDKKRLELFSGYLMSMLFLKLRTRLDILSSARRDMALTHCARVSAGGDRHPFTLMFYDTLLL